MRLILFSVSIIWFQLVSAQIVCTVTDNIGCYSDFLDGKTRTLKFQVAVSENNLTQEVCAKICNRFNYSLNGVESGKQCFCGNALDPSGIKEWDTDCQTMKCPGNKTQNCGDIDRLLVYKAECTGEPVPNYHGCISETAKNQSYCNTELTIEQRVQSLLDSLSLDEKIKMISAQPKLGHTCNCHTGGIARLGISQYMWLVETNTAVDSTCIAPEKCSTTFSGPLGMGASFNRTSWRLKGSVMGTEMRAYNNAGWHRGQGPQALHGLSGYGPNINIVRDPRFGRNSELPGEDPFLSGHYAAAMVQGMQEPDRNGHPKMLAYLKHYTAYSTEHNRFHNNFKISMYDFWDTYLPQYEIAFALGKPRGVMCSYNAENGHPSCANSYILNDVLRKWFPDAHVTTDCDAVRNLRKAPIHAPSDEIAVAIALNNGTDIEMGGTLFGDSLKGAVTKGLTNEEAITASLRRSMLGLFTAGRFDPLEDVEWTQIGLDVVNSSSHRQVQYEAALQAPVLLKNDNNVLPLKVGSSIAVVGPLAIETYGLMSDYYGDEVCFGGGFNCITTIADAISNVNVWGKTSQAKGVDVDSKNTTGIQQALDLVQVADVCVLVLGNTRDQEHEGIDRSDTALPGLQESFAQQVLALGKPVVLILVNGGAIAIDNLVDEPEAIVEAFNPNVVGSIALADSIFGHANRWGKLPITLYPHNYISQQSMNNYNMSKAPGRTYKYYTGRPLWPFGFGLSLTSFDLSCTEDGSYKYTCLVANTGDIIGDEVVMVFHRAGSDVRSQANHPVPLKSLVEFERVTVKPGQSYMIQFIFSEDTLLLVNKDGNKHLYKGHHSLIFSRGVGTDSVFDITLS